MTDTTYRSARAVDTLHRVDGDFRAVCELLYGEGVDPADVWSDAFAKRATFRESDSERTQRRVAQASNVLGLTAGTAALATAAKDPRLEGTKIHGSGVKLSENRAVKGVLRQVNRVGAKRLAVGALGLQGANVGGDVVTSRVLGREPKKRLVAKAGPDQSDVNSPRGPNKSSMSYRTGKAIRRGFNEATKTNKRKVLLVGGAGVLLVRRKAKADAAAREYYDEATYGPDVYKSQSGVEDVVFSGEFSKLDDDKRLAFGWASVTKVDGMPVIDRQADFMTTEDIETAAYEYVLKSRVGGDMHRRNGEAAHKVSDLVESFVVTDEKVKKMGLPEDTPRGWWVGFKIHDDDAWELVKKGERTGFSIHGRGRRREIGMDEAMGYQ